MVAPPETLWALGAFRSGTTLLHSLLNAHPEVALIYELNLHDRYPRMPGPQPRSDWRKRWDLWNGSLSRADLPTGFDPQPPANWGMAAQRLFSEYAGKTGARYGGEKSPVYAFSAEALLRDNPQARLIMLWREPADILRSVRHAAAKSRYFCKPMLDAWFLIGLERLLETFDNPAANVHQLSYHHLLESPDAALAKVWRFLGIDENCVNAQAFAPAFAIGTERDLHRPLAQGKIIVPPDRAEILTPTERQKIARYRQYWANRFSLAGKFADEPDCLPDAPLGEKERALDRLAARTFQHYNRAIQSLYLRLPPSAILRYRKSKGG
ncbi:sulfotransferase family protein [Cerasicoccus arenae]|uniref:Sulfotransferase n=1 Tax=Cerasicoccus arenae TaxID=424488 RepID=A0A8J3DEB8_9BACT|nr:sulfotransferase [Cerasicoccus arenae]MBK1858487.1 sulfotransferase [Cerasicoccus arenae]GHC10345.1 hypothetical protein GCM10007047_29600 [Cerasicoccus arenae]